MSIRLRCGFCPVRCAFCSHCRILPRSVGRERLRRQRNPPIQYVCCCCNIIPCNFQSVCDIIPKKPYTYCDIILLPIPCAIAVKNEVVDTMYQRSELDCLIYNKPLENAQLVLGGDLEGPLQGMPEHRLMD